MEDEIKIEYQESGEKDPLAGDGDNAPEKTDIELPNISIPSTLVEIEDDAQLQEVERKVPIPESKEEDSMREEEGNEESNDADPFDPPMDDTHKDSADWYKAIDGCGKYVCHFCDRTYTTLTSLRYHVNTKHPTKFAALKDKILNQRRTSKPTCHLCKKRFKLLKELKSHIREHGIENVANSCRYCNAAFTDTQELKRHMKDDHNVLHKKLHTCDTCGYRTFKIWNFKQHSNTHSLEKRNKCAYCSYATNNKSNLRSHELIHTGLKRFKCDFVGCSQKFPDLTALNRHLKHCSDKNVLYCDKCSYKTVHKQTLRVHLDGHMRKTS